MSLVSNTPNAGKLIQSLRSTGYSSYSAIADIVDNSLDAGADQIDLFITNSITIIDNGSGMELDTLDQALKLGSETERNTRSDLGKFGMGLITASLAIGRRLTIYTRTEGGELLYGVQDIDEVISRNEFVKEQGVCTKEQQQYLAAMKWGKVILHPDWHGTVVRIEKNDLIQNPNPTQFANILTKHLGRVFRYFISSGKRFLVNDKLVPVNDLLMTEKDIEVFSDEEYEINLGGGKKETFRVKLSILPMREDGQSKSLGINMSNQGFSVLRNYREIDDGQTLGLFQKHNDFNRFRGELFLPATLDDEAGMSFTKQRFSFSQRLKDVLEQNIRSQIQHIARQLRNKAAADPEQTIDHSDAEKTIAQKQKFLITPEFEKQKRKSPSESDTPKQRKEYDDSTPNTPRAKTQVSRHGLGARFETVSMGESGAFFECYLAGKVIVIQLNSDHAFYQKFVLKNKGDKNVLAGIDYLIYAMAAAELKNSNDENAQLLATLRGIISMNLKALLT